MFGRIGWGLIVAATMLVPALPVERTANAAGAHHAKKSRAHKKTAARGAKKQKTLFPSRRRSIFGGRGTAPLAYFVCSDSRDMAITGKTPERAQQKCERSHREFHEKAPCRCTGSDAVAVYGPFTYPKPKKERWFSNAEYPYEGTNREQYSRDGYLPTP